MASHFPGLLRVSKDPGGDHDTGRCRHGVALEAIITCWPVIPHGVAGLDRGETLSPTHQAALSCVEIVLEARGDLGGPESPATGGEDLKLSVPSAQLRPLFCVSGGQVGSDRQQTCVHEGTEADQNQVRFLEGSGCLRPRKKRKAPWGWLTLHFPWVLPCVLSRSTFVSEDCLCPGGNSSPGGWKQKKNSLGRKCPTQGRDLAHLKSLL